MSKEITSKTKPKKSPDVAEKTGKETLIFDVVAGRLYELNETGRILWSLCDGKHAIDDMMKTIREQYDVSDNKVKEEVFSFLKKMLEAGLIR
jgi:hypothetical protein